MITMPTDLPDHLPQTRVLRYAVRQLAADERVIAGWLGGSFATGRADAYSDVDLRIAVVDPSAWRDPDFLAVFGQLALGHTFIDFKQSGHLHHLVLTDGTLFDLFVCATDVDRVEPEAVVLWARHPDDLPSMTIGHATPPAPTAASVGQLLIEYWMTSHKHRKPLARGLASMCVIGLHHERLALLRLWAIRHGGLDIGGRATIHTLSPACAVIENGVGHEALQLLGTPARDRLEIVSAIEAVRDEVGRVGRELAAQFGFDYPDSLEAVVRSSWQAFLDEATA